MEKVEAQEEAINQNWSEAVEDLVTAGDTEAAISLLETLVSKLEIQSPTETVNLQLSSALTQLSDLYSSNHFSLKADSLLSRASTIKQRTLSSGDAERVGSGLNGVGASKCDASPIGAAIDDSERNFEKSTKPPDDASDDDDWEAMADRAPDELLSPQCLPSASNAVLEPTKVQNPKRRGRGHFAYKRNELYSDGESNASCIDVEDEASCRDKQQSAELLHSKYGTRHVLVLCDFPPSTKTMELEKLFEDFRDRGVAIRWVNDTAALAVFRTPSIALEARKHIQFPFVVRILDEDDVLKSSISIKDLEPPRQRPQTSARVAQRLIAQGMGLKLPSSTSVYREEKSQEEARKNRIVSRQRMKSDAWGDDET